MKEKAGIFIVEVLALSVFLYVLWYWKGKSYYLSILTYFFRYLFLSLRINTEKLWYPSQYFNNIIPFISLMLLTKGMHLWGRIQKLMIGLVILITSHMLFTTGIYFLHHEYQTPPTSFYYKIFVPLGLFCEILPFLLWVIFAKKQLLSLFISRKVSVAK